MKIRVLTIVFGLLVAMSGCVQQNKVLPDPVGIVHSTLGPQSMQEDFSDKEILDFSYSKYELPNGFYREDLRNNNKASGSVYYLQKLANDKWTFYCANSFDEASNAAQMDINEYNKQDYPDRKIINDAENEKFYEFKTTEDRPSSNMQYYLRYRVFKCGYLSDLLNGVYNPTGKAFSAKYLGRFAQRPVTVANVKELAEFLWYSVFGNYQMVDVKVINSFYEDIGDAIIYTIMEVVGGAHVVPGQCDIFHLNKLKLTVNKNSGQIDATQEAIKTVQGKCSPKENNGWAIAE
jgi:hypothetical protein